jgi:hypothetical protein
MVSEVELAAVPLSRHQLHDDWNPRNQTIGKSYSVGILVGIHVNARPIAVPQERNAGFILLLTIPDKRCNWSANKEQKSCHAERVPSTGPAPPYEAKAAARADQAGFALPSALSSP